MGVKAAEQASYEASMKAKKEKKAKKKAEKEKKAKKAKKSKKQGPCRRSLCGRTYNGRGKLTWAKTGKQGKCRWKACPGCECCKNPKGEACAAVKAAEQASYEASMKAKKEKKA